MKHSKIICLDRFGKSMLFRRNRKHRFNPALISLHWLRVPEGQTDVSIHPRHLSVLLTVVFHPCFWHDIQTTAAVFCLTSSGRSARSSLYSRQAGVSGYWCHRLERPAYPRRICAVTRGFQTTSIPSVSRSYQDTITWLVCYYYHSSLLSGHLWSLQ